MNKYLIGLIYAIIHLCGFLFSIWIATALGTDNYVTVGAVYIASVCFWREVV